MERRWWRGGCGDTFLARPGETETCVERNFSRSFSPHMFPEETCAERNFSKSFSPRNGGREGHFAQVSEGNVCDLAPRAPPRSHFGAILRRFRLVTCANWRSGEDIRGEKLFEKLLSAQVSGGNVCGEKLLKMPLRTSFGFAKPCQKGTVPRSPHCTPPCPCACEPVCLRVSGLPS